MRSAAIILLLFMAIDLGSACVCEEESFDAGATGAQSIAVDYSPAHSNDDTDYSHDCFCYCRHIQPEKIIRVDVALTLVELVENAQRQAIFLPPAPLYHPPRLIAL